MIYMEPNSIIELVFTRTSHADWYTYTLSDGVKAGRRNRSMISSVSDLVFMVCHLHYVSPPLHELIFITRSADGKQSYRCMTPDQWRSRLASEGLVLLFI